MESNSITRLISTAEDLNDLLIIENYFTKHPFSPISPNKDTINDLQRLFDSSLNNTAPNNCHMRGLLGILKCLQHFSFSKDEELWHSIEECFVNLLHKCTGYMMNLEPKDKLFTKILQLILEIIIDSSKHHMAVKNRMLQLVSPLLFDLIIKKKLPLILKKQCIMSLTFLVTRTDREIRKNVMELVYPKLVKFFDQLYVCGDFDTQLSIVETILRFIVPDKNRKIFFVHFKYKSPDVIRHFLEVKTKDFDMNCRVFLNYINRSQGENALVLSIPCYTILLDDLTIEKPPEQEVFWVDFNRGASSVSFSCSKTSLLSKEELCMPELVDVTNWQLVVIKTEVVSEIKIKSVRSQNEDQRTFKEIQFIIDGKIEIQPLTDIICSASKLVRIVFPKSTEYETLERKILPEMFKMRKLDDLNPQKKRKVSHSSVGHFLNVFSTIDSERQPTNSSNSDELNQYMSIVEYGNSSSRKVHSVASLVQKNSTASINCLQSSDSYLNGSQMQGKKDQIQGNSLMGKYQSKKQEKISDTKTEIEFQVIFNSDDEKEEDSDTISIHPSTNGRSSLHGNAVNHIEKENNIITNEESLKENNGQSESINHAHQISNTAIGILEKNHEVSSADNSELKINPTLKFKKSIASNLSPASSLNESGREDDAVNAIHLEECDQKETKKNTICLNVHSIETIGCGEMGKEEETIIANYEGNNEGQRTNFPNKSFPFEQQSITKKKNNKTCKHDLNRGVEAQENYSSSVPLTKSGTCKVRDDLRKQSLQIIFTNKKRKKDGDNICPSIKKLKTKQTHLNEEVVKSNSSTRRSARIQNARKQLEKVGNEHWSNVNSDISSECSDNSDTELSGSNDFQNTPRKKHSTNSKTKQRNQRICMSNISAKSTLKTLGKKIIERSEKADKISEKNGLKEEPLEKKMLANCQGNPVQKTRDKKIKLFNKSEEISKVSPKAAAHKNTDSSNIFVRKRKNSTKLKIKSNSILDEKLSNDLEALSPVTSNKKDPSNIVPSNISGFSDRNAELLINNEEIKMVHTEKPYLETNSIEMENKESECGEIEANVTEEKVNYDNTKEGEDQVKERNISIAIEAIANHENENLFLQQKNKNNKVNQCGEKVKEPSVTQHCELERKQISIFQGKHSREITCIPETLVISEDESNELCVRTDIQESIQNVSQNPSKIKDHFPEKADTKSSQSTRNASHVVTKAIVHAPSECFSPKSECEGNTFITQSIKVLQFFSQNITSLQNTVNNSLNEQNKIEDNENIVNTCIKDSIEKMYIQETITNELKPDTFKLLNNTGESANHRQNSKGKRKLSCIPLQIINKGSGPPSNNDIQIKRKHSKTSFSPNKKNYQTSVKQLISKKNSSSRSLRKRKVISYTYDSQPEESETIEKNEKNISETSDLNQMARNSTKKKLFTQNQQDILNLCSGSQSSNAGENNDLIIPSGVPTVSETNKVEFRNKIHDDFDKLLVTSPPPLIKRNPSHWAEKYRKEKQLSSVKSNAKTTLNSKRKTHSIYSDFDFDSDSGSSACNDNGRQSPSLIPASINEEKQKNTNDSKDKSETTFDRNNLEIINNKTNKENCVQFFSGKSYTKKDTTENSIGKKINEKSNLENVKEKKLKRSKDRKSLSQKATDKTISEHGQDHNFNKKLILGVNEKENNKQVFETNIDDEIQKITETNFNSRKKFNKTPNLKLSGDNNFAIKKVCDHRDVNELDEMEMIIPVQQKNKSPSMIGNSNCNISGELDEITDQKDLCLSPGTNSIQNGPKKSNESLETLIITKDTRELNQNIENTETDIQTKNNYNLKELKCEIQNVNCTKSATERVEITEKQKSQKQTLRKTELSYSVSGDAPEINESHNVVTEKIAVRNTISGHKSLTESMVKCTNFYETKKNTEVTQHYFEKGGCTNEFQQNAKSTFKKGKFKEITRQYDKESEKACSNNTKSRESIEIMKNKATAHKDLIDKCNMDMSIFHENPVLYRVELSSKELPESQNIFHEKLNSDWISKNKMKNSDNNLSLENDLLLKDVKAHFTSSSKTSNTKFELKSGGKSKQLISNSSYNMQEEANCNSLQISLCARSPDLHSSSESSLEIQGCSEGREEERKEEDDEVEEGDEEEEDDDEEFSSLGLHKRKSIISSALKNDFQKSMSEKFKYVKELSRCVSNAILKYFSKSSSSYINERAAAEKQFNDDIIVNIHKIENGILKLDEYATTLEKTYDEIKVALANKNQVDNELQQSFSHMEGAFETFASGVSCEQKFDIQQLVSSLDEKYRKETLKNMLRKLHNIYDTNHKY